MKEKITIRDIAERAGTSKTTVSFFLNGKTDKMSEETQARIAQVIKETNYRPSIAAPVSYTHLTLPTKRIV